MNAWLWAATVLLGGLALCGIVVVRANIEEGLVALELAAVVSILVLLLLARGFGQPSYLDVALALAVLGVPASLVFAHFLERWL